MDITEQDAKFRVTIDVFSGRPNPTWEMTSEEAKRLLAMFRAVSSSKADLVSRATPPGLGYRGIVVTRLKGDETVPEETRVFNSILSIRKAGSISYHEDNAKIQEFFLSQAKAKGHAALIEKMSATQRPSAR